MCNVFIVEDTQSVHEILKRILSQKHRVEGAYSLREAIKKSDKNNHPDVLILDLNLGDGSAEDYVKSGYCPDDSTIIILSADNMAEQRASNMFNGREYYVLRKPFKINELTSIIQKAEVHHALNKLLNGNGKTKKLDTSVMKSIRTISDRLNKVVEKV